MSLAFLVNLRRIVGGVVFILILMGTGLIWFLQHLKEKTSPPQGTVLAIYGKVPFFSLTERNGNVFSQDKLVGKPWIANFIFTRCAGQCPLVSLKMQKLQRDFPKETGVQFVSFTVDPEYDTPEALSQYADSYHAEKNRWFFLTGPKQEINRILKEFFLSPVEEPAMHSIRFILVDGAGQIRGYYDSSDDQSMKQLIQDTQILLKSQMSKFRGPSNFQ